jgi:hypothetical protein
MVTILLYCQTNYNILFPKKLNTYLSAKISSGNDERYETIKNDTEIQIQVYNLSRNIEKKKLLDILQDDKVSINIKIELLKDNSIKANNLKSGGLFNYFDFD